MKQMQCKHSVKTNMHKFNSFYFTILFDFFFAQVQRLQDLISSRFGALQIYVHVVEHN